MNESKEKPSNESVNHQENERPALSCEQSPSSTQTTGKNPKPIEHQPRPQKPTPFLRNKQV